MVNSAVEELTEQISMLYGNTFQKADKQCCNAAVPRRNISFQGMPHTSCLIFSKSFIREKRNMASHTF